MPLGLVLIFDICSLISAGVGCATAAWAIYIYCQRFFLWQWEHVPYAGRFQGAWLPTQFPHCLWSLLLLTASMLNVADDELVSCHHCPSWWMRILGCPVCWQGHYCCCQCWCELTDVIVQGNREIFHAFWNFGICSLTSAGVCCATATLAAYLLPVILFVAMGTYCTICWALSGGMSATAVPTLLVVPANADSIIAQCWWWWCEILYFSYVF